MLERIFKLEIEDKKKRKIFIIAIFFWNLVIYSIPLNLLEYKILRIPKTFLVYFTSIIASLLKFFNLDFVSKDNIIYIKEIPFVISEECVGYKSVLGLFAIIMATPLRDIKIRIKWFVFLAPIAFIINIVRVFSTIIFYYFFNIDPYFLHNVLWSILTTFIVILFWVYFYIKNKKLLV